MAHLYDELRQRGVLRVAAVYLVAAWIAIQVSDVTFPRLGLPDWTVTFVIVTLAALFPVVVALAWIFDLTRTGPRRREEEAPTAVSTLEPAPARVTGRVPVLIAALMAVPLIAFGLWWANDARASTLDDDLVAVTPFRIAGASSDIAYLREGLMDLVAARIGGASTEGGIRAVPPRTMSRRIREDLGSLDADPETEQALELARSLGAGRLLEGEVVGGAGRITVTATLYDAFDGRVLVTTRLPETSSDSLHSVVDALASQLIAAEAGLRSDRLAAITTRSMPALRAFIEGEHAFRRGEHARAVRSYDQALQLDTTFTLAALGLLRSTGWAVGVNSSFGRERIRAVVRRGKEQLSESDRAFFELFDPAPGETMRARLEDALATAARLPDQVDLQYLAADRLLHYGESVDIRDAVDRARRQFETVVAMDSTYGEPIIHLYELAIARADTAGMLRYGALLLAIDSTGGYATKVRYVKGAGLDGSHGAPHVDLAAVPTDHLGQLSHLGWMMPPNDDVSSEIVARFDAATVTEDRERLGGRIVMIGIRGGRPSLVRHVLDRLPPNKWTEHDALVSELFWTRDLAAARAAAGPVRARIAELRAANEPGAGEMRLAYECLLARYEATAGDLDAARGLVDTLEAVRATAQPELVPMIRTCVLYLNAAIAVRRGAPDAAQRVAALDTWLADGPAIDDFDQPLYNLALASLWDAVGRRDRALVAARRRIYTPYASFWTAELLAEQARLADALGLRDEAIEAYRAYLGNMSDPEAPFEERANRARARLAALAGETRR